MLINREVALSGTIAGALLLAAFPASAAIYDYDFASTDGQGFTLDGTITASDSALLIPATGQSGYAILDISGVLGSTLVPAPFPAPDNINGLIANPNINLASGLSPSGYSIFDNALYSPPSQPYLDNPGVLFTTAGLPGVEWNLFSIAPDVYSLDNNNNGAYWVTTGTMRLYLEPSSLGVAATPLPAALPLFAAGLGVMGLLDRRRKRKNSSALAPA
jgi:hypothetical protein